MKTAELQAEALSRATGYQSTMNYAPILEGFSEKGIPMDDIIPRVNVFTFNAWKALGRSVKKGEHGIKCITWIPMKKTDKKTGEITEGRRPWTTTVFHISQTEPIKA